MSDRRSVNHGSVRPASLATPAGGDGCQWILASSSPRRRALLRLLGHPFRVIVPAIDETPQAGERPAAFARRAAMEKALAVAERLPPLRGARWRIVIACDTIVVLGHRILGKPRDAEDARRMLRALSGRTHAVLSGLCVRWESATGRPRQEVRVVKTAVEFRDLSAEEIERYVATGEPLDKAGAYAIQGRAAAMVRAIRGSWTNVVGLPLAELADVLARLQGRR